MAFHPVRVKHHSAVVFSPKKTLKHPVRVPSKHGAPPGWTKKKDGTKPALLVAIWSLWVYCFMNFLIIRFSFPIMASR